METLRNMGCSREAVSDVRGIGNVTLLAVNNFMIPIIRDMCGGVSITESFLKDWNINRKVFFYTAFNVVMGTDPLPKHCYDMSVGSCGLAFEWALVIPGLTLHPAIVRVSNSPHFERMDSRPTAVMVGTNSCDPDASTADPKAPDV